jgi:hypothetical protein
MAQYIDKDALVAEIERRLKEYRTYPDYQIDSNYMELCDILSFLNTLEVKEEKEEPIILTEEMLKKNGFLLNPRPRYNPPYWSKLFTASDGREYLCKINIEQKIRETLMTIMPLASNDGVGQPTCYLPHPKTVQQLQDSLRLFNIKDIIEV